MGDFKRYLKKVLCEDVNDLSNKAKTGKLVASWESETKKLVKHNIYYVAKENNFYQTSEINNDIYEVKVIEADHLKDYIKWFSDDIFQKLTDVLEK